MSDTGKKVAKAALLLMITVIISRILGYGREVALYTLLGQDYITDAFRAAFSIPDFLYMLLVGGALSSAFIPVFSECIATDREEQGWWSFSVVFNYTILFLLVLIAIAYLYTRPLIILLVPGLPEAYLDLAVSLTRIMFMQTFFMALNGFAMGILNSFNHFAAPALGSLVYNLIIIVIGVAFFPQLGITAFAYGVVIGAVLNFMVQIPALKRAGIKYHFSFDYHDPGFKQIMILMVPVLAGLGVVQLNLFVTQNLSSGLGAGAISALNLAQKIMNLPMGIFAVSIATALFPTLTTLTARGEIDMFKRTTSLGVRAIFLVTIPASLGLIALGEPLIRLLFEQGKFTAGAVTATNQALFYYSLGLFAYSAIQVLNRSFYALKDTLTPVIAAAVTIGLNIFLSLQLVQPMGHQGLALAYSLAGFLNLIILLGMLRYKVGALGGTRLVTSFLISLGASLLMYGVVHYLVQALMGVLTLAPKITLLISVGSGVAAGMVVYAALVYFFHLEETELVLDMVRKRLRRA